MACMQALSSALTCETLLADPGAASDCTSTLPSHFASVTRCNSRMQRLPAPGPLAPGQLGFKPALVCCEQQMMSVNASILACILAYDTGCWCPEAWVENWCHHVGFIETMCDLLSHVFP